MGEPVDQEVPVIGHRVLGPVNPVHSGHHEVHAVGVGVNRRKGLHLEGVQSKSSLGGSHRKYVLKVVNNGPRHFEQSVLVVGRS